MKPISFLILILFSIVLLSRCAKEYSCEGECCGGGDVDTLLSPPLGHPIKIPPRDTAYNELISYYDFYIVDNSKVKKIYLNVQDKYIPGHYYITDTIPVQTTPDGYYHGFFNLKYYYDMSRFSKGDTFKVFYEIRYRDATQLRTDTTTLIY